LLCSSLDVELSSALEARHHGASETPMKYAKYTPLLLVLAACGSEAGNTESTRSQKEPVITCSTQINSNDGARPSALNPKLVLARCVAMLLPANSYTCTYDSGSDTAMCITPNNSNILVSGYTNSSPVHANVYGTSSTNPSDGGYYIADGTYATGKIFGKTVATHYGLTVINGNTASCDLVGGGMQTCMSVN
jgi:hypothetical protein